MTLVGRLSLWLALSFWAARGVAAGPPDGGEFRRIALSVPKSGKVGFTSLPASATGIHFTNLLAQTGGFTNQILLNGSGVAAGDVDGDGWCDLYFCNLAGANALYRNLGGWRFANIAEQAGVACPAQNSTGAAFADVDGDGDLDLLVAAIGHGVRLFLNDGKGHFTEATAQAGLASEAGSMTLALADVDGDGDLDLYVSNYRTETFQDHPGMAFRVARVDGKPTITMVDGRPASTPGLANRYFVGEGNRIMENGEADVLYLNDGHGKFAPVSWTDGNFLDEDGKALENPPLDWTLSAMFRDINGDGAPDLYVCSDTFSTDHLWINDGHGRFRALPRLAQRETSYSSMGVDFADINRDGFDDFFVTDMLACDHTNRQTQIFMRRPPSAPGVMENRPDYQRNTLFVNRGDGTFKEVAQFAGVDATDWTWSPVFLDVDLDGYEDLLITTGQEWNLLHADTRQRIDMMRRQRKFTREEFFELRKMYGRFDSPNFAFRNQGDLTFADMSSAWGFDSRQFSQGICLADLDNDGDLDVAINCLRQPALVYRNDADAPRVAVRLHGRGGNTHGIGAKITVLGGPVTQSQQIISGGRYASSDEAIRAFAAGTPASRLKIETTWRSGATSVISNALPNSIYEIIEPVPGAGAALKTENAKSEIQGAAPWFTDATANLRHIHRDDPFDDFARQPLLTKRLSQFGPGVSWFDFDGDGLDDLMIGTGRGGVPGLLRNLGNGRFQESQTTPPLGVAPDDQAVVLGWSPSRGTNALLLVQSTYEAAATNAVLNFALAGQELKLRENLPTWPASAGPAALADVDGDGDLDLFVGGRVEPGRFPAPCSSRLYRNERGRFVLDEANSRVLEGVGLVNGAVFSDLNGDGTPELIVAAEWGPLQVFRNSAGKFQAWVWRVSFGSPTALNPQSSTLNQLTGWWQGVSAGDFDGDGRMDLVASNWGRNGRYQRYAAQPIEVVFGDWNEDGIIECLEGYRDPGLKKLMPWQTGDKVATALPFTQERINNFEQFSVAGIEEVFREFLPRMARLQVNTFDSCVFLNRGDRFEVIPLPTEAQLAPAFGVSVGDLDGDGDEDIFLNQNFFAVDTATSRYDAGRGLWLRGDGRGRFEAMAGQISGVMIYGEGRGAALCDYDGDGRVDLAAAQNGTATKLFHNERARPGLRVRLSGPAENPAGIGATIRLLFGQRLGPAREIHLGSGYLSQDSAVQVMATPEKPTQLLVRWPGGKETTTRIPPDAREVGVNPVGEIRVIR